MKFSIDAFDFIPLNLLALPEILDIQEQTFLSLTNPSLLRKNDIEMLKSCLSPPHYCIGALHNGVIAGFAILFFPEEDEENLALKLKTIDTTSLRSANYKLCIVREQYRGNNLQVHLGNLLEKYAIEKKVDILCATVSPENKYSMNNVLKLGFLYDSTLNKYGLNRNLYYKLLKKNNQ